MTRAPGVLLSLPALLAGMLSCGSPARNAAIAPDASSAPTTAPPATAAPTTAAPTTAAPTTAAPTTATPTTASPATAPATAPPAAPASAPLPHRAPEGSVAWETVVAAQSGRTLGGRAEAVIRDEAGLRAWAERVGLAMPEAPDFASRMVLAVDGQDGSNGCHAVRITGMRRDAGGLHVKVTRYFPLPDRICTMMMVRPTHAVHVPAGPRDEPVSFAWEEMAGEPAS